MYFPYLRGKQYELILLRDNARMLLENNIHPIIEPVKTNFSSLIKALTALQEEETPSTLIINPRVGDYANDDIHIPKKIIEEFIGDSKTTFLGYIMHPESDVNDLNSVLNNFKEFQFTLVHYGFTDGKVLASELSKHNNIQRHVFIDIGTRSKLYERYFKGEGIDRILIRDGFKQQAKNAYYPQFEHFSDLHITYTEESMDGFGDFLIVGDDFREAGGPAYAVAIHLTYLDEDDDMFIFHFLSDQTDSPTNPGGKFLEALEKLVNEYKKHNSRIFKSDAVSNYLDLYKKKHYPGLGYVKKLSMQHHMELIADYLRKVH